MKTYLNLQTYFCVTKRSHRNGFQNLDENFSKAIDLILNSQGRLVVCGMGKSGSLGHKISATLFKHRHAVILFTPGEAFTATWE